MQLRCLYGCRHAETEIKGSGRLPQCPACEHVISQVEIKQICGVGELLEKYDQILLRRGLNSLEVLLVVELSASWTQFGAYSSSFMFHMPLLFRELCIGILGFILVF